MAIYLKLLGYFELRRADGPPLALPTRKAQALLAYLAAQTGRPLSRDTLTALLWPDRGEKQARHSLTQTLYTLRKALDQPGAEAFLTDGNTVALNRAAVESDIAAFEELAAKEDAKVLEKAAHLYGGDFLEGLILREEPFMEWLSLEQARLRERALSVLTRQLEAQTNTGNPDKAIDTAHRLLALDPLQEHVHRALMTLFADQGRVTSALRQYGSCEETLRRELGVDPDAETRRLYETFKARQDAASESGPVPDSTPDPAPRNHDTGEASRQARAVTGPEYKQATVLAAVLADQADQAEATSLSGIEDCITQFGGTVQHRNEREILALFGAPTALEDHAERACRAALALSEMATPAAALRVCLDSGGLTWRPAASGNGKAEVSGTPMLRAIDLAQSGMEWPLVVTGETRSLARRRIVFERAEQAASGTDAETLFTIMGERDPGGGAGQWVGSRPTAFFGREDELQALKEALDGAGGGVNGGAGGGHGRAVAIAGEPGVGKSRMLHEFLHGRVPSGWRVLHCGGISHGRDIPYLPLKTLLRGFFGVPPQADPDDIRKLVCEGVTRLDPSLEATLPALLSLFEVEESESGWDALEPAQKRRRIIDAIKALLYSESRNRPLVIAVEDLHWIDSESERVLKNLMDGLPAARQLLLVNFRPEYRPDWTGRSWVRQITIGPLSEDSAATMLDWMLGEDPGLSELKHHLIGHTGANPFFLEECVHTLADRAIITGRRGEYSLRGDPASVVVPETVQAVIADRMDRLDTDDKHVLQTAAVIGYEVPHALLDEVCNLSEELFYASLDRLKDGEFLVETRPAPESVYGFKHALTHGAAYESIMPERRRALHADILSTLEGLPSERRSDRTEALAHHASRGEIWDKAVDYYKEAGLRAAARSANGAAVAHYEQALAALERLPETSDGIAKEIDLRFDVRNALFVLGDHEAIPGHLDRAEELARKIGDMRRVGWAKLHLGGFGWQSGQYDAGLDACRAAMDIAERCGDLALGAMARYRTGLAYHGLGRFPEAVTCFENCIAALDQMDEASTFALGGMPYVFCCSFLAWSHAELGQFDAANLHGERGWQMARGSNHTYSQAVMAFGWAHALMVQDRTDEAVEILEKGMELYEINEAHATFPWISAPLGYARIVKGDPERGLELLHRAVSPSAQRLGVQYASPYLWLAEALLLLEREEEAREAAETARKLSESQGEGSHLAWATRLLGDIAVPMDPAAARTLYEDAMEQARKLELAPQADLCRRGLERLTTDPPQPA